VLWRGLALALVGAQLTTAAAASPSRSARAVGSDIRRAPDGANFTVTSCADSGPGSLRQAMLDAHDNTTIDLSQLTCGVITLTTGALTDPGTDSLKLSAPPSIVGGRPTPRVTIDGYGVGRVIEHRSGGQLELYGIAVRNGFSSEGKGGCIYAKGHTSLTAVTITGCNASGTVSDAALGGGIWSNDEIDLVFSTVSGNRAFAAPGGYSYGGGVFTTGGLYSIFSTIHGNDATGFGYGGGVSVNGFLSMSFSTIDSNTAAYGAGLALFAGSAGPGDVRITSCTITANHASGLAGGVEADAPLEVYNSTIAFNTADRADTPSYAGGVVMEGANVLHLVSSIVARNQQGGVAHDIGGSGSIAGSADLVMSSSVALPAGTIAEDPLLADTLANHGGQTETLELPSGSPAIDAGSNPLGLRCDQRGGSFLPPFYFNGLYERQHGAAVDIGASERGAGDRLFVNGFENMLLVSCW